MSWQAFSWQEIMEQARASQLADRVQPAIDWTEAASYEFVRFVSAFLTPLALTEGVLGVWRLGSDLGWAGDFFISSGLLSHWQLWIAASIGTQCVSRAATRWLKKASLKRPEQG